MESKRTVILQLKPQEQPGHLQEAALRLLDAAREYREAIRESHPQEGHANCVSLTSVHGELVVYTMDTDLKARVQNVIRGV